MLTLTAQRCCTEILEPSINQLDDHDETEKRIFPTRFGTLSLYATSMDYLIFLLTDYFFITSNIYLTHEGYAQMRETFYRFRLTKRTTNVIDTTI